VIRFSQHAQIASSRRIAVVAALVLVGVGRSAEAAWLRAGLTTNAPMWGRTEGLGWAIWPGGFGPGDGGPRGLIRLGYPIRPDGGLALVNFIAVEPVVQGRRGFSEMETSGLDRVAGLRIAAPATDSAARWNAGILTRTTGGIERLEVPLEVERFANGAHVRLTVAQASDRPDEIELTVHAYPDSAAMDECILSATMGNMARARMLWLRDGPVRSLDLYADYRGNEFAPHRLFPLDRLYRDSGGDAIAAITTDEADPSSVFPFPNSRAWYYPGAKVTQYWRAPAPPPELQVAVNGRRTYWMSQQPIPGGIAFENFEFRRPFADGQRAVFGITRKAPAELGFPTTR
jgi:hypothetical protein